MDKKIITRLVADFLLWAALIFGLVLGQPFIEGVAVFAVYLIMGMCILSTIAVTLAAALDWCELDNDLQLIAAKAAASPAWRRLYSRLSTLAEALIIAAAGRPVLAAFYFLASVLLLGSLARLVKAHGARAKEWAQQEGAAA